MAYSNCPNCGKSLTGFLSPDIIPDFKTDFINKYQKTPKEAYCTSCSTELLKKISLYSKHEQSNLEKRLKEIIHYIPIMTCPAPINWEYEIIGMVSSQTTAGTGFLTELSRSFNDLMGSGSNATNRKISVSTSFCKADLRIQCVKNGGNAVISTDIDFNEIGSGSTNMLMVCMAGTAISVKNMENFHNKSRDKIEEVISIIQKLDAINL